MTMLLPLHQVLNVPLERLCLVVDNARSPAYAVSNRNCKSRRKRTSRSYSWDGISTVNRWSSMPTDDPSCSSSSESSEIVEVDHVKSVERKLAPARSRSVDATTRFAHVDEKSFPERGPFPRRRPERRMNRDLERCSRNNDVPMKTRLTQKINNAAVPVRKPVRQTSQQRLQVDELITKTSAAGNNNPLRQPVRQGSIRSLGIDEAISKDTNKSSTCALRKPVRQASSRSIFVAEKHASLDVESTSITIRGVMGSPRRLPSLPIRSPSDDGSACDFKSSNLGMKNVTTVELLARALEEI